MHIADEHGSALLERGEPRLIAGKHLLDCSLRVEAVDADVNDRGAWLHVRLGHKAGAANRRDEHIRFRRKLRQIGRARMRDGHGRVAMQQQERHRLADDVAAADDDGARPGDRNVRPLEDFDDAGRRAGDEAGAILHKIADINRMEPVDVLVGAHDIEDSSFGVRAHRGRQRRLHEDAVVLLAAIQRVDHREQIGQRRIRR